MRKVWERFNFEADQRRLRCQAPVGAQEMYLGGSAVSRLCNAHYF